MLGHDDTEQHVDVGNAAIEASVFTKRRHRAHMAGPQGGSAGAEEGHDHADDCTPDEGARPEDEFVATRAEVELLTQTSQQPAEADAEGGSHDHGEDAHHEGFADEGGCDLSAGCADGP